MRRTWLLSPLLAFAVLIGAGACGAPSPVAGPSPQTSTRAAADGVEPELARLSMVGPVETVFDWTTDRCDDNDIPDLPARAFRDASGAVQVIATHHVNRRFVGPSLDGIRRDCAVVMASAGNADPAAYADREWLAAPYTEDGRTIYALVHDEYHGHEHVGRCPQREYFPCWYNSITLAVSTDAGVSYRRVAQPPGQLVAAVPQRYEAGAGPFGFFEPSNIVKGPDGGLYAFVRVDEFRSDSQRICLIRTDNIRDPRSWRAWDGTGFGLRFADPYRDADQSGAVCAAVDPYRLGVMGSSITFNTYLNRYVMVGTTAVHADGREVWGVAYSFSDDLIAWTPRRLLAEVELPWTYQSGEGNVYLYPSLLDPASSDRTFGTSSRTAYLYLTRFNTGAGGMTLDRDLVKIPVAFDRSPDGADAAQVPILP